MLKGNGERDSLSWLDISGKAFSIWLLKVFLAMNLSYMSFIVLLLSLYTKTIERSRKNRILANIFSTVLIWSNDFTDYLLTWKSDREKRLEVLALPSKDPLPKCPGQSQEPEIPSWSPTWVAEAQVFGLSCTTFWGMLAESWIGSRVAEIQKK